jgi:autotransporter-associated beta strand protein
MTLQSILFFYNNSTAGSAEIADNGNVLFEGMSTGGTANITNNSALHFYEYSSAGRATILTMPDKITSFEDFATGGNAQLITDASGWVDFSKSAGPAGDHNLSVGSIEGAGTYILGSDHIAVGSNGLSRTVNGLIADSGLPGDVGVGGVLVKVGRGRLTLSHTGNTYSGGTTIEQGTLDLAAIGAAGTGAIGFAGKANATLAIENAALSAHHLANAIDNFGKHDFLDLTGLHFHTGAMATYHKATHRLTVDSGGVSDTLTLLSPHGTHFGVASDHHGGTDVFLMFA